MTFGKYLIAVILTSMTVLFYCGCNPEPDIALKHAPDQLTTYKSTAYFHKDYLFNQPTEGKKTVKVTETNIEVVYDQAVTDIDEKDNTTAEITLKEIKYVSKDDDNVRFSFDSSTGDADEIKELIGVTYMVRLSPSGKVLDIWDVDDDRKAITSSRAKTLLDSEQIEKRHEILALPDRDKGKLDVGDKWSRVAVSPKRALIPKTYEKDYTVKSIIDSPEGKVAIIEMEATPTAKEAPGDEDTASVLGMFSDLFEAEDDYTGKLVVNLDTGKVYEYIERLRADYTAAQFPSSNKNAKEPDVLKLGYTEIYSIESVD